MNADEIRKVDIDKKESNMILLREEVAQIAILNTNLKLFFEKFNKISSSYTEKSLFEKVFGKSYGV